MAFEELEVEVTGAVIDALANAQADFGAGVRVRGIFEAPGLRVLTVVNAALPTFTFIRPCELEVRRDDEVIIGTTAYRVSGLEPEEAGLMTIGLAR